MSCFSKISENNNEIVYDENVDKRSDHTCVCYVGVDRVWTRCQT